MDDQPVVRAATVVAVSRRMLPLAVVALGLALVLAWDLDAYLDLDLLRVYRAEIVGWVAAHRILAVVVYVAAYTTVVALSVPGAVAMTVAGGFLFGTVAATAYVVGAATLGSTLLFLAARHAAGGLLRAKAGGAVHRLEEGFRRDALSYLLILRLVPLFPFWLVNLVPALLGIPLRTFVIGTLLGIIPGTLVFASIGSGLSVVFERGDTPGLDILSDPQVWLPLLGLAVLASLPVLYRLVRHR